MGQACSPDIAQLNGAVAEVDVDDFYTQITDPCTLFFGRFIDDTISRPSRCPQCRLVPSTPSRRPFPVHTILPRFLSLSRRPSPALNALWLPLMPSQRPFPALAAASPPPTTLLGPHCPQHSPTSSPYPDTLLTTPSGPPDSQHLQKRWQREHPSQIVAVLLIAHPPILPFPSRTQVTSPVLPVPFLNLQVPSRSPQASQCHPRSSRPPCDYPGRPNPLLPCPASPFAIALGLPVFSSVLSLPSRARGRHSPLTRPPWPLAKTLGLPSTPPRPSIHLAIAPAIPVPSPIVLSLLEAPGIQSCPPSSKSPGDRLGPPSPLLRPPILLAIAPGVPVLLSHPSISPSPAAFSRAGPGAPGIPRCP